MTESNPRGRRMGLSSLVLGLLAILVPMIGALGTRFEFWSFVVGLLAMPLSLLLALVGLALGIVSLLRLRKAGERLVLPAHGAGLSLLVSLYLANSMFSGFLMPPIHNVSTDIEDPPQFTHAQTLRGENANPLHYDGAMIGPLQREGYPDVRPLVLDIPKDAMYQRVKMVLQAMRMEVTREDPEQGEIEAVATTFWFGFKDDIIVRLRAADGGTRLDIRSVSRVGVVDIGANAERIVEIIKRVRDAG